jgi:hypothetical protein
MRSIQKKYLERCMRAAHEDDLIAHSLEELVGYNKLKLSARTTQVTHVECM